MSHATLTTDNKTFIYHETSGKIEIQDNYYHARVTLDLKEFRQLLTFLLGQIVL